MTVASADINMQMKHNVICHVTKVKPATSAHSMADVIPFSVYSTFALNRTLRYNQKKIYFIHNKENNIRNIFRTFMFQQLSKNEHHRLRDSVPITIWPSGGLRLVTDKKKITRSCYSNLKPRLNFWLTRSCYSNLKPRLYFWLINSFLSQKSRLNLIRLYYE